MVHLHNQTTDKMCKVMHYLNCQKKIIISIFSISALFGQLVINEFMSSNSSTLYDESGNTPDWIELYNENFEIDLTGFGLSDDINDPFKWVFPTIILNPETHLLIFASGEGGGSYVQHWETVINWGDEWEYFIGTQNPPSEWTDLEFDDASWLNGPSGFGYGDGDDATTVPSVMSVFVRRVFNVDSVENIISIILHVDYDDAFVAYLNGSEIARRNIGIAGVMPNFDEGAYEWREAEIYNGGYPEKFDISYGPELLIDGDNILSIQVHNYNLISSDMSLIPFLTLGMTEEPENSSGTPEILEFPLTNLHTNFRIESEGEVILITNPNGEFVDLVDPIAVPTDASFGRQPDGGDNWLFYFDPTPNTANITEGFNEFCETPEISHQAGFYPSPIEVSLSINSEIQQIFYTLDGSLPTLNSYIYSDPILVETTKVLRTAAIHPECPPGEITTHSFFIDETQILPIVSLTTDPYNFWDDDYGIYTFGFNASPDYPYFGANFWEDWERPIHIELFEPDGELGFSLNAGVKIFGGWSRGLAQKSLAIYARPSYGTSQINYQIFPDKQIDSFKTIVLRNSGNDWFGGGQDNTTMLRDGMNTGLMDNTGVDHQAYRPAVVYINGEYWGIHNLREKVNEEFLATNNPGVDPDELDELEFNGDIIEGDNQDYLNLIDFISNNSLSTSDNYSLVQDQVDIENIIKYYLAQIYFGNTDWPGNNIKFWRPHIEDAKWKWILYDTDFGFGLFWWASNVYHNTLLFALDDNGPEWPNPPWSTLLFRKLMENVNFQNKFINHFCFYFNTRFSPAYVESHISGIVDIITPEMPNHIDRWGGSIFQWNQNINGIEQFGSQRIGILFNHISDYFDIYETSTLDISAEPVDAGIVSISGLTIPENNWEAVFFNDIPMEIAALANPGYIFSHWEGIIQDEPQTTITLNQDLNLTAIFTESNSEFFINEFLALNDSIFQDEAGEFDDWIEIYNSGDEPENIGGLYISDNAENLMKWMIPNGTFIQPQNFLLFWADEDQEQGELHTNFKLNGEGESLLLVDHDGITILDSISYGTQSNNISYGRMPDGGNVWQFFENPTPDSSNSGSPGNILGDLNGDGLLNVVDVVLMVYLVLDDEYDFFADMNTDVTVNILDIVLLANTILGNTQTSDASMVNTWQKGDSFYLSGNGYIGAVQMTLSHNPEFNIMLTDSSMVSEYRKNELTTTLIIVNPESAKIFTTADYYNVEKIFVANSNEIISIDGPESFSLNQAYPNPFNSSTSIDFSIPFDSIVSIIVYDLLGKKISVITDQKFETGYHTVNWNADAFSSGIYFVKMMTNDYTKTQKLILIK